MVTSKFIFNRRKWYFTSAVSRIDISISADGYRLRVKTMGLVLSEMAGSREEVVPSCEVSAGRPILSEGQHRDGRGNWGGPPVSQSRRPNIPRGARGNYRDQNLVILRFFLVAGPTPAPAPPPPPPPCFLASSGFCSLASVDRLCWFCLTVLRSHLGAPLLSKILIRPVMFQLHLERVIGGPIMPLSLPWFLPFGFL